MVTLLFDILLYIIFLVFVPVTFILDILAFLFSVMVQDNFKLTNELANLTIFREE